MGTTGFHIPAIVPIHLSSGLSSSPHLLAHPLSLEHSPCKHKCSINQTDCYFHFFLQIDTTCIYIYHALAGAHTCPQLQNNQSFSVMFFPQNQWLPGNTASPVTLIPQCFMLTRLSTAKKKTNKRNKQKPQQPHNEKQKNKQQKLWSSQNYGAWSSWE